MAKSQHLRLSEVRAVYLLVGECRELGADPLAWQTYLLRGLMRTLGAAVGAVMETDPTAGPPPPDNPLQPSSIVDYGWPSAGDSQQFQRLVREMAPVFTSVLPVVLAPTERIRTFTRRDVL